ncbi:MAG: DUF3575 domain-containing protein, partial [Muribaculaceae bacterium]|nr:DUF3575 domain-containing protein [Muribaculaceae bacterium]
DRYMGNTGRLNAFERRLDSIMAISPKMRLRAVQVSGAASPEGIYSLNSRLALGRAKSILRYLQAHMTVPDSIVSLRTWPVYWSALRSDVATDANAPDRGAVLALFRRLMEREMTSGRSDSLFRSLKALDGGIPYRYLLRKFFPDLREATLWLSFYAPEPRIAPHAPERLQTAGIADSSKAVAVPLPDFTSGRRRRPRWALRTNLLFDVLAAPTIGAELYIARGFSVQAQWTYAWWSHRASNFFYRIYGGDFGFRWWFGRQAASQRLSGHHIGVYAQAAIWDFEFGGRGYMGGVPGTTILDRANIGGGVEYGYSLPVARRLNMDFSIGLGYMGGSCREYIPQCGFYVWQATRKLNYIGPTKAEVSLV